MYRIVSRFLALFYFYLPPRLSFSLLLKRTTNTLSSFRGGKISEEKEEIRENRPENEATFFREILIKEFHLRNRKKLSLVVDDWYAHTQTHTLSLSLSLVNLFSLLCYLCKPAWLLAVSFFFPKVMVFASDTTTDRIFC